MTASSRRDHALAILGAAAVTALLLYPLSVHPGRFARIDRADGQFSLWNVAWVARTVVADPLHLFDANIFYPNRRTLLYSEANLVAGVLAVPSYWATRDPYIAHNSAVLLGSVLTALGTYWLVVYLTGSQWGAAVSAICFTFCPFVFAHSTHVQLLMTPGIPLSMLAFHRMADRPSRGRAVALGVAMAATAFSCAYYGVFMMLVVGFAVLVTAAARRSWSSAQYWSAVGLAAGTAAVLVLPLYLPYTLLQHAGGFDRPLQESDRYGATWRSYLASGLSAHSWMLAFARPWTDVAFPGFVAVALGIGRLSTAWRLRGRAAEIAGLYGGLTALALWASFGPKAGLYTALYYTMPGFTLMRAPVRLALIVTFALSVSAGCGVAGMLSRARRPAWVGAALVVLAIAESWVPLRFPEVTPPSPAYAALARLPSAPVIEMPFFDRPAFYSRHTIYMLMSTLHWKPLVNGYSDYTPPTFAADARDLASFPFPPAFATAKRLGVRYAMFHLNAYDAKTRAEVEVRLREFAPYLRPLYTDADTRLYEIAGFP
jgi:hypothetical protein